jgi:tRNA pseudouridine55 synthase
MKQDKEYVTEITFGITTPTLDLESTPVLTSDTLPTISDIQEILPQKLQKYHGEFDQRIPNYSAKKIEGKPMYKLARTEPSKLGNKEYFKKVNIAEIKILNSGEKEFDVANKENVLIRTSLPYVELKVVCSHGTYIRALADDLGRDLGCGAVMTKLVRTKVGNYAIENSIEVK